MPEQILDQSTNLSALVHSLGKPQEVTVDLEAVYGVKTNNNTKKYAKYFETFSYSDMSFLENDQLLIEKFL